MNHASLHPLTNSSPLITPAGKSLLQRKCACGNQAAGGGECAECGKKKLQRQLRVGASNDSLERKADRVANQVIANQSAPAISSFNFGQIQRQEKPGEPPKEKTEEEKYKEAGGKLVEAFLETPVGKQLTDDAKKAMFDTWKGRIITGTVAAGTITALAGAKKELPVQLPELPLDFVTPGLSIKFEYNGPVNNPTGAALTFIFKEQGPAAKKPVEKFPELAAIRQAEKMFPRQQPAGPDQKLWDQYQLQEIQKRLPSLKPNPQLTPPYTKSPFQLTPPEFGAGFGNKRPSLFGDQFKLRLPDEQKKKDEEGGLQKKLSVGASNDPLEAEAEADRVADQVLANNSGTAETSPAISSVQRHSSTTSEATDDAPTSVNQTLSGSGKPLDKTTRTDMESRFGHDFSQVRIHQGSTAEKSARDVNANAYTLGNNIVFGAGQFNPESQTGKRLLAHELTHVIQQSDVVRPYRPKEAFNFGKSDTATLIEDSFNFTKDKDTKPWINQVDVKFSATKQDADGNNFWLGKANAQYFANPVKLPDFTFDIAGGSAELGKSDKGNFVVHRLEGVGYNSGSFSGNYDKKNREGPLKRYSKDLVANMSFAVFYNKGEALHAGPVDASSHGCVHVDWSNSQQLNYHSVIGKTKVSVAYP